MKLRLVRLKNDGFDANFEHFLVHFGQNFENKNYRTNFANLVRFGVVIERYSSLQQGIEKVECNNFSKLK
jgi:hypothetical protein